MRHLLSELLLHLAFACWDLGDALEARSNQISGKVLPFPTPVLVQAGELLCSTGCGEIVPFPLVTTESNHAPFAS